MADWKIYACLSAIFAGLTAIFAKIGVKEIPSNFATLIRTFVIVIFLTALVVTRGEWTNVFSFGRKSLFFLLLSGVATGISWVCYFRALQTGPVSMVSLIDRSSILLAVLLAVFFLGERLNLIQWSGALLMTAGALLMTLKS